MAAKLKNLKIKKVDFVDEGANPDAHIRMVKRKDGEEQIAEEESKKGIGNVLKRMFNFIGKAAGMNQEEIESVMDEIQKGDSVSFNEKINEVKNYKIADEIWDTCYALQSSLCSILNDKALDNINTETSMQESLDEFYEVMQESIKEWSGGKSAGIVRKNEEVSEADLEIMKSAVERMNETIKKSGKDTKKEKSKEDESNNNEISKGDEEEMKIDKSKLTDAERAFLESIEKRCGTEDRGNPGNEEIFVAPTTAEQVPAPNEPTVSKSGKSQTEEPSIQQTDEPDNIYKGLHSVVKAELEGLKKFREEVENKKLTDIAKRYAIIGKKEDELVPLFKSLKAAGGTAYNDMIALLDQAVDVVEKSGAFSEIGKSGYVGAASGGAWAEAEIKAVELMKSKTGLSKAQALDEVLVANPELAERCEKED